jgi:hypothetical protein
MMPKHHCYAFFGMALRTPLSLDALPLLTERAETDGEAVLDIGEVPASLQDIVWASPFVQVAADGAALIEIGAVGRFHLVGGHEIRFAPSPEAIPAAIESILLSIVAGVILHQRGVLPLHASCVDWRGTVVAIAGPCGRGKSTLAAALLRHGATLIAEDITPVRFHGDTPHVAQGAMGLRLWPDAVAAAGGEWGAWTPVRPGHAKRVCLARAIAEPPRRLDGILRLEVENGSEKPGLRRLRGSLSAIPMQDLIYRLTLGRKLGRRESLYRDLMRLAGRIPVQELRRSIDFDQLDSTVALAVDALQGFGARP